MSAAEEGDASGNRGGPPVPAEEERRTGDSTAEEGDAGGLATVGRQRSCGGGLATEKGDVGRLNRCAVEA